MAEIVRRAYSALPWGDMWDYWRWYLSHRQSLITGLFAQHNEHRIVVARLFFLADHLVFHGSAVFLYVSIFVIQMLHAMLLCKLTFSAGPSRRTACVFVGAAAFICLFSAEQYTNFTWSFQIQFVAVYLAVTASLTLLTLAATKDHTATQTRDSPGRLSAFGGAIAMAIVATYSMANGLLLWPVLIAAAFWLKMQRRAKVTLLVVSVVMWVLYLWHYMTPPQHSSLREALHHVPKVFAFSMCVLGSPAAGPLSVISKLFSLDADKWRLVGAAGVGACFFIAGLLLAASTVRRRDSAPPADAVIVQVLLFLVITFFLIGVGRANFPLGDALQSRYATPALLFWFCTLFLSVSSIETGFLLRNRNPFPAYCGWTIGLLLGVIVYQPTQLKYARDAALYESESQAAISAPVYDEEVWQRIYYDPSSMVPVVRFLQISRLSIFASDQAAWVGDPLNKHFRTAEPNSCLGFFDDIELVTSPELPGLRLRGWSWNARDQKVARSTVFTDERGIIVGYGYSGYERDDVRLAHPEIGMAGVGWAGYVSGIDHQAVSAYVVLDNQSSVCPVGSQSIAHFRRASIDQMGPELAGVPVKIIGSWRRDGYYPSVEHSPLLMNVIGSWDKGDGDTGSVALGPFTNGDCESLLLPLVTGPRPAGMSIRLVDVEGRKTLAGLAPPPITEKWNAWEVSLPRHGMRLELIAEDKGTGWGQWMALGFPHAPTISGCR